MSDAIIAIKTKDFVLLTGDANAGFSIIVMKHDEDKIAKLGSRMLMAVNGENGDRVQFTEYIKKNLALHKFRNENREHSTHAAASFVRHEMAQALRQGPYNCNMLLGGYDEGKGASLYFIDYLASSQPVNFGAHGYGSFFILGLLDKYYSEDLTLEQAKSVMKACIDEIARRLVINSQHFLTKVVTKDGISDVDLSQVSPP